ncbi:hypothetical protein SARC_01056 [Sphaeroforma arctica JP610]|uniref:Uncharacterized protein n=1 Tax=Sphaeroforma arctica JP610 TaxID=667725 RepID=A0A0L0GD06_9EUKA|nr:hypothetical protein SARC_01056 [Sphaeroforma arctica JP610]KNC86794.1 hypothetical protein SARC_01056 [Sphaeroforma arctica JP610]|eukprot:XP_014160696.1 hypothetical protein SARC_01056 [Sphaeroforma arctica JP610]
MESDILVRYKTLQAYRWSLIWQGSVLTEVPEHELVEVAREVSMKQIVGPLAYDSVIEVNTGATYEDLQENRKLAVATDLPRIAERYCVVEWLN